MKVYKYNQVFSHIEQTLMEYYGNNPEYDRVLVILGYNILDSLHYFRKKYEGYKIIIYQLEQLYAGSIWVGNHYRGLLKAADEIWDYDVENIKWMNMYYELDAKFKPLMYTESLKVMEPADESKCDIDVLFYGYLHERRAKLIFHMQHKFAGKKKIFDLSGVWGKELDEYISRTKIVMNVRSGIRGRQEQPRIYYPVINGRCVVSETSRVNYMGDSIVQAPYAEFCKKTESLLKTGEWLKVANQASEKYREYSEKHMKFI